MKIEIERIDSPFFMRARNENGNEILMDSSANPPQKGFGPMQLLIAGIGGCSSIDIVDILSKQREPLEDIKVSIEAQRQQGKVPALWEKIHLHFLLFGNLDENKAKRAIELSMNTYCSVAKTLEKTAQITWTFEIIRK